MDGVELKNWFDQAYKHMEDGDFVSAAKCFECVINKSGDPNATRIAEQRLRWYCIPLEAILKRMQECANPIDIHHVLSELFASDSLYLESGQQPFIQTIESELKKLSSVIRVSERAWGNKKIFAEQLDQLAQTILLSNNPLCISSWLISQFRNCEMPENYPDNLTLSVIESQLREYPIIIFDKELAISKEVLSTKIDSLFTYIQADGQPIALNLLTGILFPELPSILAPQTTKMLRVYLDSRFIEIVPDIIFLTEQLKLNTDTFEDIFQAYPLPITTEKLVCARFFPGKETRHLAQEFVSLSENLLAQNRNLKQLGKSHWILKRLEQELYANAEDYLLKEGNLQSSQNILEKILPADFIDKANFNLLIILLDDSLGISQNVFMVGDHTWIALTAIKKASDKSYQQLLHSTTPLTTNELLISNLDTINTPLTHTLIQNFENLLQEDGRFSHDSVQNPHLWRAFDSRRRDNQAAYNVLRNAHKWLSLEEIRSLLITNQGISTPIFDLNADDNFKPYPSDYWGLKKWISINEMAYEYLLKSRQALHAITIVGLICKQNSINKEDAIFTPMDDPRFKQDSINRWFCRHLLAVDEINLLQEELIKYGGVGRRLDDLMQKVLHLNADSTDAGNRLQADDRFIYLDGIWFSRQAAFYALTPEDVEKLYSTLASQPDYRSAMPLKELVSTAIGHDGRLTNASELLCKDQRFTEVHEDFWALKNAPNPDFDRLGQISVAVHQPKVVQNIVGKNRETEQDELNPRKRKSKKDESTPDQRKKEYITLNHLDILHGNLRITGMLKQWIPAEANNVHFRDEEDFEFIAYLDETHLIVNIREWLENRHLTYGDKIFIQQVNKHDELLIQPYGERDIRIYQEALDHQEIEKLIDEARTVNKNFHDLIIEVMENFDFPLHREDIYQLVNYQRTASRNTIFEILSLPDCPFDELRYFIPTGSGYWKFDRKRKEVYDMKIQELQTDNDALRNQLINIQNQLKEQKGSLDTNSELFTQIEQLQKEKKDVEQINLELKNQLESLLRQVTILQSDITERQKAIQQIQNQTIQEKTQLQDQINTLTSQVNNQQIQINESRDQASLQAEKVKTELETQTRELEKKVLINSNLETELAKEKADKEIIQKDIDQLREKSAAKNNKMETDFEAAKANSENFQKEFDRLKSESLKLTTKLETDLATVKSSNENMQREIEQLRYENAARINQLENDLAKAQQIQKQIQVKAESNSQFNLQHIFRRISNLLFGKKS
jgi:hypothetical protein